MACTIMRAWSSLREGLVLMQPKTMEEQLRQPLFWNPGIKSEDGMMLGQKKYLAWEQMLGYNISLVRDWEVFRMKRERQTGSTLFTSRLEKVTQVIDKAIDGLTRLNDKE